MVSNCYTAVMATYLQSDFEKGVMRMKAWKRPLNGLQTIVHVKVTSWWTTHFLYQSGLCMTMHFYQSNEQHRFYQCHEQINFFYQSDLWMNNTKCSLVKVTSDWITRYVFEISMSNSAFLSKWPKFLNPKPIILRLMATPMITAF